MTNFICSSLRLIKLKSRFIIAWHKYMVCKNNYRLHCSALKGQANIS